MHHLDACSYPESSKDYEGWPMANSSRGRRPGSVINVASKGIATNGAVVLGTLES